MPNFKKAFYCILVVLAPAVFAADQRLPSFRTQLGSTNWMSIIQNNPFIDLQSTVSTAKADPLDMKKAIRTYVQNLFREGLIKGYAFSQQGRPVGIILQNAFYKEGEYLPEETIPEVGRVSLKITAIRPAYMTVSARPLIEELNNAAFVYEITLQLPDLR